MKMYYYNKHENYSDEYVSNAKRIEMTEYTIQINKNSHEIEFKQRGCKKIFYFNRSGVLQEYLSFCGRNAVRETYTYSKRNKPVSVFVYDINTHVLDYIIILHYDEMDRIETEQVLRMGSYALHFEDEESYYHEYDNQTHTIEFSVEAPIDFKDEDYDDYTFEEKINDCNHVVELKVKSRLTGFRIHTKYVYSRNEELLQEIDYDEQGEITSETFYDNDTVTYLPREKDLKPIIWEYKYEYNEHKHWVNCHKFRNGDLQTIIEKKIDYFEKRK